MSKFKSTLHSNLIQYSLFHLLLDCSDKSIYFPYEGINYIFKTRTETQLRYHALNECTRADDELMLEEMSCGNQNKAEPSEGTSC